MDNITPRSAQTRCNPKSAPKSIRCIEKKKINYRNQQENTTPNQYPTSIINISQRCQLRDPKTRCGQLGEKEMVPGNRELRLADAGVDR